MGYWQQEVWSWQLIWRRRLNEHEEEEINNLQAYIETQEPKKDKKMVLDRNGQSMVYSLQKAYLQSFVKE